MARRGRARRPSPKGRASATTSAVSPTTSTYPSRRRRARRWSRRTSAFDRAWPTPIPHYDDVTATVGDFLGERRQRALDAGIAGDRIVVDAGLDLGKTAAQSLQLLRDSDRLAASARRCCCRRRTRPSSACSSTCRSSERREPSLAAAALGIASGVVSFGFMTSGNGSRARRDRATHRRRNARELERLRRGHRRDDGLDAVHNVIAESPRRNSTPPSRSRTSPPRTSRHPVASR